ncbi:MAG: DUF4912 domain-containing protein [Treponema sp.]|nr:DUF4912 domain-containing protein [Treponema sp.]
MEQSRLVRPYLDSLTTQELVRMADACGIDIPPNLERIFIIEELLDYARAEEDEEDEEALEEAPDYLETAPIPRRYNVTFIDLMIRDPLWVFVFWEVKEHDGEVFALDPEFLGYRLRVQAQDGPATNRSFMIQIGPNDTARYLGFSEYPVRQGEFRVELCAEFNGRIEVLAASKQSRLPRLPGTLINEGEEAPPLVALAGLNDFPIFHDTDRPPSRRFSCDE